MLPMLKLSLHLFFNCYICCIVEPVKNVLAQKSLEEFYQVADGYYPAHLPKYPSFRLKSAPTTGKVVPIPPQGFKATTQSSTEGSSVKGIPQSTRVTPKKTKVSIVTDEDSKSVASL